MTIKKVASWSDTKFITYSSFLFSLPVFVNKPDKDILVPSLLLFSTSIISANFWRNALYDWRRTLDIYFARLSFSYFFIHGLYCIPWPYNFITSINTFNIGYCYHKSGEEYERKNKRWVWYHVGFHASVAFNVYYILKYFPRKNCLLTGTPVKI